MINVMAVTNTLTRVNVKMLLNNGTDPSTGEIKTVSVSLGSLSTTGYDDAKMMSVVSALNPLLTKSVYSVKKTMEYTVTD